MSMSKLNVIVVNHNGILYASEYNLSGKKSRSIKIDKQAEMEPKAELVFYYSTDNETYYGTLALHFGRPFDKDDVRNVNFFGLIFCINYFFLFSSKLKATTLLNLEVNIN